MKIKKGVPSVTTAFVVAAAVLLAGAPMAYADPQDGNQQCPDQQGTQNPGPDQQCQNGGGAAEKAIDKVKDEADQAQRQLQQQQQQQQQANKNPMSQGVMYLVNGVPTCLRGSGVLGNVSVTPVIPVTTC